MPPYRLKLCLMYKSRLSFGFELSFLVLVTQGGGTPALRNVLWIG